MSGQGFKLQLFAAGIHVVGKKWQYDATVISYEFLHFRIHLTTFGLVQFGTGFYQQFIEALKISWVNSGIRWGSVCCLSPMTCRPHLPIKGEIPSPINIPPGCRFAGRCPDVMEQCHRVTPEVIKKSDSQGVACLLYA